jgi:hypothetical protein
VSNTSIVPQQAGCSGCCSKVHKRRQAAPKSSTLQPTVYHMQSNGALRTWFLEVHEGEKVHALVFGFLKQCVDPPVVTSHEAQGVQVPDHATHHAWHTRHLHKHLQ